MQQIKTVLIILSLLAAGLACNLGAPRPAATPTIPVTTEAVESLLEKLATAEVQAQAGAEIELVLTESEVTSLVVYELEKTDPQNLTEVQVYLREGQMQVFATYRDGDLTVPLNIVAQPEVTSAGNLRIVLVSAKLGPVSAPDVLRNQIQTLFDEQIASSLTTSAGDEFRVTSVKIADGLITIRGSLQ